MPSEVWLSSAGIGLLLAASGTFLATRWATLTIDAKLVVLVTLTLASASAARWLRDRLPATAEALVHLAWGLVVVDVAAAAVRSGTTTATATALAAGAAVVGALGLLQRSSWLAPVVMGGAAPTALVATGVAAGLERADTAWIGLALAAVAWLGAEAVIGGGSMTPSPGRVGRLPALTAGAAVGGLLAGAMSAGLGLPDGPLREPDPVSAVALAVAGLLLAASSLRRRHTLGTVSGVCLAVFGQWWWALLIGIDAVDAWLAPTAVAALVWMAFRLQRDPERELDSTDRTLWALASAGAVAGSLLERSDGGPVGHVIAGVAIAVALVLLGGLLRVGAPLFIGLGTLVSFPIIELVNRQVTVATWVWMGLAGLLLAGGGALLEYLDTSPTTAGRELRRRYGTTFR